MKSLDHEAGQDNTINRQKWQINSSHTEQSLPYLFFSIASKLLCIFTCVYTCIQYIIQPRKQVFTFLPSDYNYNKWIVIIFWQKTRRGPTSIFFYNRMKIKRLSLPEKYQVMNVRIYTRSYFKDYLWCFNLMTQALCYYEIVNYQYH